jgi:uncharacterized membrane protein
MTRPTGANAGNEAGSGRTRPSPPRPSPPPLHHPVVLEHAARRADDVQLRIADRITGFAGSMSFVYLHAALFAGWMLFVERAPWPTLTLVVSLEAIFLSTFVMIGQNRQAEFQRAKADHDFATGEQEFRRNAEVTNAVYGMTADLHRRLVEEAPPGGSST